MIHRIMLAAALLAVPAIVVAEPLQAPAVQHPDSAKAKSSSKSTSTSKSSSKSHNNKKSTHETSAKPAAPAAMPHDSGK
jgi:cytoskeletal protein RodZ